MMLGYFINYYNRGNVSIPLFRGLGKSLNGFQWTEHLPPLSFTTRLRSDMKLGEMSYRSHPFGDERQLLPDVSSSEFSKIVYILL